MSLEEASEVSSSKDSSSIYPDFKDYHQRKPDGCLASKKNHIEQNFFIARRRKKGRSSVCNATCAFCLHCFSSLNTTRMHVHLIGEEEGLIELKREPYRIDLIAGRSDI